MNSGLRSKSTLSCKCPISVQFYRNRLRLKQPIHKHFKRSRSSKILPFEMNSWIVWCPARPWGRLYFWNALPIMLISQHKANTDETLINHLYSWSETHRLSIRLIWTNLSWRNFNALRNLNRIFWVLYKLFLSKLDKWHAFRFRFTEVYFSGSESLKWKLFLILNIRYLLTDESQFSNVNLVLQHSHKLRVS